MVSCFDRKGVLNREVNWHVDVGQDGPSGLPRVRIEGSALREFLPGVRSQAEGRNRLVFRGKSYFTGTTGTPPGDTAAGAAVGWPCAMLYFCRTF